MVVTPEAAWHACRSRHRTRHRRFGKASLDVALRRILTLVGVADSTATEIMHGLEKRRAGQRNTGAFRTIAACGRRLFLLGLFHRPVLPRPRDPVRACVLACWRVLALTSAHMAMAPRTWCRWTAGHTTTHNTTHAVGVFAIACVAPV